MMIPVWLRVAWKNVWNYLTLKYTIVVCLCLWALYVQMVYRVPSQLLFLILPWISMALVVLSFLLLMNHLLGRFLGDDLARGVFGRIEWGANLLIRVLVYYSLLVFANGKLDRSLPVDRESRVLKMTGGEIDIGMPIPLAWVDLASWKYPGRTERLLLQGGEQWTLWSGEPVVVQTREGFFKIPWVLRIERDEEKYSREIFKLAPSAAEAWKNLISFYLDHQRWREASGAMHEYLKIYPNAYDFALYAGGAMAVAGQYEEGIALLDYVVGRRPTYAAYQQLGWALSYQGNKARAAKVLETSIPLKPHDWEAYYHLGYVYSDMGKYREAVAMFEKVLERQPNFPEVVEQLRILGANVSSRGWTQHPKGSIGQRDR